MTIHFQVFAEIDFEQAFTQIPIDTQYIGNYTQIECCKIR